MSNFKKGDKVKYIGRGFLSYHPDDTDMFFIEKVENSPFDVWVEYKGKRVRVRDYEIKLIK